MRFRSAVINFNTAGDNTVVALSSSAPVKIYGLLFTVGGATNITFKDTAGTNFSGAIVFTGNGSSMTLPIMSDVWYQCEIGNGFVMNSSSAVQVSGTVWYALG